MSEKIVTVPADELWVDTGVEVGADSTVWVEYVSGAWTANPDTEMVGASGDPRWVAKAGYNLPDAFEGALVGRVGDFVFLLGDAATPTAPVQVPVVQTGALELSINDDMFELYGGGFADNLGALEVRVTWEAA